MDWIAIAFLNRSFQGRNIGTRDEAMKRAGLILKLNYARKYFRVKTVDSSNNNLGFEVSYELDEVKIDSDRRLDGTFVIQSNADGYDDEQLIKTYKNLSKVETAFKTIKNDLDIRPLHHWKEARVKGHVYLCVLSYFMVTAIEYTAAQKELNMSARKILMQLRQIGLLDINLPDGTKKYSITTVQKQQKQILSAYNIKKVNVPNVV